MVDTTIEVLKKLGEPYSLTVLDKLQGYGLNDDDDSWYDIRRLEYRDIVILEQMERVNECDSDDIIYSREFTIKNEPKPWPLEIKIDIE